MPAVHDELVTTHEHMPDVAGRAGEHDRVQGELRRRARQLHASEPHGHEVRARPGLDPPRVRPAEAGVAVFRGRPQ